jgi:uncharacterized iron-regulated membrane protein
MNVAIGLLTALGLLGVVVSGTAMWFGRMKQRSGLGAPPPVARRSGSRGWASVAVLLCLLLPLLAVSAAALWLLERLVLRRIPAAAAWLGLLPSRL